MFVKALSMCRHLSKIEPQFVHRFLASISESSKSRIDDLVKGQKASVVLFMKGTPDHPMCGFSKAIVDILNKYKVFFESHDILMDEQLRADMKTYSDWPTFPQVYINGTFQGGYDIFSAMEQENKLKDLLVNSKLLDKDGNAILS